MRIIKYDVFIENEIRGFVDVKEADAVTSVIIGNEILSLFYVSIDFSPHNR